MSADTFPVPGLTRAHVVALTTREDLLRSEAEIVSDRRQTWAGRLRELEGYGRGGGSALDRRLVVEGMVALEKAARRCHGWLTNQQAKIAHYFDADGRSRCHLWTATTLDRPAPAGVPRCPSCVEMVALDTGARPGER